MVGRCLVAGDGFGGLFVGLVGSAVAVGMAVAVCGSDRDRLARVGEVGGNRFRDVGIDVPAIFPTESVWPEINPNMCERCRT